MSAEVVARMDTSSASSSSTSSATNFPVDHHAKSAKNECSNAVLSRHDGEASGNNDTFIMHVRKDNLKSSEGHGTCGESRNLDGDNASDLASNSKHSPVSVQTVVPAKQGVSTLTPMTATASAHLLPHHQLSTGKVSSIDNGVVSNPAAHHLSLCANPGIATFQSNDSNQNHPTQEGQQTQSQKPSDQVETPLTIVSATHQDTGLSQLQGKEGETSGRPPVSLIVSAPILKSKLNDDSHNPPLVPISSSLARSCSSEKSLTQITKRGSDISSRTSFSPTKSNARQGTRPRSNSVPTSPSGCGPLVSTPAQTPDASASAGTVSTNTKPSPQSKQTTALRRGKWTVEEEAYVARVIQDFNSGFLNAPAGTTLRTYLSEKLHCDPMRITKKFTGDACIGKRVFHPAVRCANNAAAIDKAQTELDALERRWRRRLEMQQRESAKKAAASAAAAAAAASGRHHLHAHGAHHSTGATLSGALYGQLPQVATSNQQLKQSVVTQTASWLDRANAILSIESSPSQDRLVAQAESHVPPTEVENQMKDIQLLIHEGPMIQQTSAGLPRLLDKSTQPSPQLTRTPEGHHTVTDDSTRATSIIPSGSSGYPIVVADCKRKVSDDYPASTPFVSPSSVPIQPSLPQAPTQASQSGGSVLTDHKTHQYPQQHEAAQPTASMPDQSTVATSSTCKNNPTEHDENNVHWPQDKRPRRSLSANHLPSADPTATRATDSASSVPRPESSSTVKAAEEEAEALVAFLHSVRASAAASESSSRRSSG